MVALFVQRWVFAFQDGSQFCFLSFYIKGTLVHIIAAIFALVCIVKGWLAISLF